MVFNNSRTTCLRVSYKSSKTGQNALKYDNHKNRQSVYFNLRLIWDQTASDKRFTRPCVGKSMYFQNI